MQLIIYTCASVEAVHPSVNGRGDFESGKGLGDVELAAIAGAIAVIDGRRPGLKEKPIGILLDALEIGHHHQPRNHRDQNQRQRPLLIFPTRSKKYMAGSKDQHRSN
jgi:hypothetical protein